MPSDDSLFRGPIFVGEDGLRAGWIILLFVALVLLFNTVLPQPAASPSTLTPRITFLREGEAWLTLIAAAWVTSRVTSRTAARTRPFQADLRRIIPDFALGLVWGFLFLSLLAATLLLTHHLVLDSVALHGSRAILYAVKWAAAFLCVSLFEEFLFRGFVQETLTRGLTGPLSYASAFWLSAFLLSGVFFAVTHLSNGGETASGILAVALAGAVFAFSLWRTASLSWAIGFHTSWDWAQTFFYGTPDSGLRGTGHLLNTHPSGTLALSGASAGPEGSLFVLPTLLLALLVIHLTLPYRPRPETSQANPQN